MTFFGFLLKNLLRRKARSVLTILGVAVAMATIVGLRGVAHGFQKEFQRNFEHRGADLIVTAAGVPNQLSSNLDERLGTQISQLPGVSRVVPGLVEMVDFERGDTSHSVMVNGWQIDSPLFDDLKFVAGRTLQKEDRRKILLGQGQAEYLNKTIGDTVRIQRQVFTIVGIYQSFTVFENKGAILPLAELQALMLRKASVTGFSVVLGELPPGSDRAAVVESMKQQIESLTDEEGERYRIAAETAEDYVKKSLPIRMAHAMAWVTSFIAVLIGAISMLNTMIMSVMERTKEIGVLRALGWRKRRVIHMILGEALLLSLTAMVVGSVAAFLMLRWLSQLPDTGSFITGELSPVVLVEGFFMTLIVAIIGGSYPAIRAACWLPSEALRHE